MPDSEVPRCTPACRDWQHASTHAQRGITTGQSCGKHRAARRDGALVLRLGGRCCRVI